MCTPGAGKKTYAPGDTCRSEATEVVAPDNLPILPLDIPRPHEVAALGCRLSHELGDDEDDPRLGIWEAADIAVAPGFHDEVAHLHGIAIDLVTTGLAQGWNLGDDLVFPVQHHN